MTSLSSSSARAQQLARQVAVLDVVLSANSEDWKPRAKALVDVEQLISDGLQEEGYEAFSDFIAPLLTSLHPSLQTQITDLRSEIVRQSAHTVAFLAVHVPHAFTKCVTKLFPALLRVASGTNGVMRSYAAPAAEEVVKYVAHASLLLDLLQELRTSKNKVALSLCSQLLATALHQWNTKVLRKYAVMLEESSVALLSAAEASTRSTGAECVLSFLEHFPQRSRQLLQGLDPRSTKLVNEGRTKHEPALNAAPITKVRSDSVSSIDGAAGLLCADEEEETKQPPLVVSRPASASVGGSLAGGGGGGGGASSAAPRLSYGVKVELVEALTNRGDVDDSTVGVQLVGRKGTVISHSQREGRIGDWVGVRLDVDPDGGDEERKAGVQVVYVRAQTLRREGWRVTRMRAPTIDTSHGHKTPAQPHSSASSNVSSASSLPPSPAPSSASSHASLHTPLSARSLLSQPSRTTLTPSPGGLKKSISSASTESLHTRPRSPGVGASAPSSSSSSTSAPTVTRLMTSPPLTVTGTGTATGRSSTSPMISRIPSAPLSSSSLSRSSALPPSRIPLPPSRIPSRSPSRLTSRVHSRATSGHFSLHSSPSPSDSSSPSLPATATPVTAPPSLSLTQPLPITVAPSHSSLACAAVDSPLASLLSLHRAYDADVTTNMTGLRAALVEAEAATVIDSGVERDYSERMIKLLSDQLTRTTRLLEAFVGVKKRTVEANKNRAKHDSDAFDAWLGEHDNFR